MYTNISGTMDKCPEYQGVYFQSVLLEKRLNAIGFMVYGTVMCCNTCRVTFKYFVYVHNF